MTSYTETYHVLAFKLQFLWASKAAEMDLCVLNLTLYLDYRLYDKAIRKKSHSFLIVSSNNQWETHNYKASLRCNERYEAH